MRIVLFLILFLITASSNAEIIKPDPTIKPIDVILIQLKALQNNNDPFENAGITQTWEFAHPNNRMYTGPLSNFIRMLNTPSYSMMLDHLEHKILPVQENEYISYFFVELVDLKGSKYGFQWSVSKVNNEGKFKDCWMTSGVSQPMPLAESA